MAAPTADQRRDGRRPCDYDIRVLDASSRPVESRIRLVDMSASGLGILTGLPLEVGDALGVKLNLSGSGCLDASCRVRWARPERGLTAYGLEFEGLGWLAKRRIAALFEAAPSKASELLAFGLQCAAAVSVCAMALDLVRSDPALLSFTLNALPFLVPLAGISGGLWALSQR
ncbi:MAG TPA: hypothetical protein DCM05_12010 [Elusimicrobia bacterium]|nr:hypothetical protein [Elusimicrobiota bacterium]